MKNILKFIFIFCLFFTAQNCFAKNETITVISDVHLSSDKTENKMTPSIDKLLKAINQTNVDTSDCVVFLGDNIQSDNRVDAAMFAKVINKLKKTCYVVIGNRDIGRTKGLNKKEYYRILNKFSSNKIKTLPTYKKQDDLIFVFMFGVNETFQTYKGYYKASELEFLDETLEKFKDEKVIIFQHFPVIPPEENKEKETYKAQLYLDVLAKHNNVLAVVSGHYHKEGIQTDENNVKHISVASLGLSGEYEQIKIFKNKDGSYSITTKILSVE